MKRALLFSLSLILSVSPVMAQENTSSGWSGSATLGAGVTPDYDGADEYQAIPFVGLNAEKGPYWARLRGLEASANVLPLEFMNAGPVARYRFGRDDDVDSRAVSRLREVDDSVEVGGFVSTVIPQIFNERDGVELSAKLVQDVTDGHDGHLGTLAAGYSTPVTPRLRLNAGVDTTYASEDYMDSYFTVDRNNAARSGLSTYYADAGFKDVGASLSGDYALQGNWALTGVLGYTKLIGEAADSPVVEDEGSEDQGFAGLGVSYRF